MRATRATAVPRARLADPSAYRTHAPTRVDTDVTSCRGRRRTGCELVCEALLVEVVAPLRDDDRGDAVADHVRQGASLRHEAIDAGDRGEADEPDIVER